MEELQNISTYKAFKAATDREVLNQAEGFVRLGYLLRLARDTEVLRDSGYASVVEFAEGEYGLTETYVSRYIAINKRYSKDGYSPYLMERFQGYGMAKLAEMLTLSSEVVEALPPELPKAAIQEVKREIRQEQEITDLEVILEGEETGTEGETNLEKWLRIYFRENKEEWQRAKKTCSGAEAEADADPEGWVMDVLAPTGIAAKMARIKGVGKLMLTIKGKNAPIELVNLRTNEKETYSLKACASAMRGILTQEPENVREQDRGKTEGNRNEETKNRNEAKKKQDKSQKQDESVKWDSAKETEGKNEKIALVQEADTQTDDTQTEARQMEVEDYPEILPEGYVPPSAYIQCHNGSEVTQKKENEAEELIRMLFQTVSKGNWNLDEVYRKVIQLVEVLGALRDAEG